VVEVVLLELGCAELGVAWQLAGLGVLPPIFTMRDRDEDDHSAAIGRLRARGLLDQQGALAPELHIAIAAFAATPVEVELRSTATNGAEIRAVVTAPDDKDGLGTLAVITGGQVRLSRLPGDVAFAALVDVLPAVAPAKGTLVSLPIAEVDAATTSAMANRLHGTAATETDLGMVLGLAARGISPVDARLFVSLVGSKSLRLAEFGVTTKDRDGARRRSCRTVQAVDTPRGRAVRYTVGDYLFAAPAARETFVRALTELRDAELARSIGA
jgi:hypothetical protein